MPLVLIIDDNPDIAKALEVSLGLIGIDTCHADSPSRGLERLHAEPVDLVIQDMNFTRDTTSGEEGVELFHRIRAHDPDLPIILLTAWTDLETAVELVRAGAADYLGKPWDEDKLQTSVKNLLELREVQTAHDRLRDDSRRRRRQLAENHDLCGAVYASEIMHQVFSMAVQVAAADVPVLITGPNGAGKDVVARVIQANSKRRDKPFVTVNIGALPASLMEAELFGAEAGAFTGSAARREGRFEAADGGTLFLDEIGNLSTEGQVKLLRVLQTGEYERLGSSQTRRADVRIVSATNANLAEAIRERTFREDLYYRLNLIEIDVPPLAQRAEDILPLATCFLADGVPLSAGAEQRLVRHSWPGNVRELQNVMRRASILAGGSRILPEHLGLDLGTPGPDARRAEPDEDEIRSIMADCEGNVSRAARRLGLSRQALYRRLEKLSAEPDGPADR
ncbi:sigma-54-dependent transcriptional regulator [Elongatibacter sediminis]|uniref:Sigma-54 dependent transcriptional regulator n=1 Tax=Elongatibacter sediminis TaxID=3119006 RepID=A0AAW9RKA0_9GAMM